MIRQPLLLKLLLVFLVTGILILSAVAAYMNFFMPRNTSSGPHLFRLGIKQYIENMVSDIGTPPNFERARELATEIGIGIHIDLPDGKFWQSPEYISPDHSTENSNEKRNGRDRRNNYYEVTRDGTVFTFFVPPPATQNRGLLREIMWLIGALVVILMMSFLVIRWLFRPLQWLMTGVHAISQGRLDYQVSFRPGDEFESLATAFNQMTGKVNDMIKAREQLLLDLSHELRSPLARMQVSTEFIEKRDLKESLKEDLQEMEDMVSGVLEGARMGHSETQINKSEISLRDLLKELVEKYQNQKPGVKIETSSFTESPMALVGDRERIKSAFRNLIENALKYSSTQTRPVEVGFRSVRDGFEVNVTDHGIGIPSNELNLIFEPFYRVDKSRTRGSGGFGLGLNICRKIIEAHGGQISLQSTVEKGTTFTVWLPKNL